MSGFRREVQRQQVLGLTRERQDFPFHVAALPDSGDANAAPGERKKSIRFKTLQVLHFASEFMDRPPLALDRRPALAPVGERGIEKAPFLVRQIAPTKMPPPSVKAALESARPKYKICIESCF
jgi:hypothetical protein